jgi:deoxycytidine triphosphate deaminase
MLELSNVATLPIKLWPGMKVGQLCRFRRSSPTEHPDGSVVCGSRYQDQRSRRRGPTATFTSQGLTKIINHGHRAPRPI